MQRLAWFDYIYSQKKRYLCSHSEPAWPHPACRTGSDALPSASRQVSQMNAVSYARTTACMQWVERIKETATSKISGTCSAPSTTTKRRRWRPYSATAAATKTQHGTALRSMLAKTDRPCRERENTSTSSYMYPTTTSFQITHVRAYTHAHTRTCTHAYTHVYTRTHAHSRHMTHTHTHSFVQALQSNSDIAYLGYCVPSLCTYQMRMTDFELHLTLYIFTPVMRTWLVRTFAYCAQNMMHRTALHSDSAYM